jgi:hypothetical protein
MDKTTTDNQQMAYQIPNLPTVDEDEFEKLKMVYERAAEHHKYYLSWRQFILSGFFAVISVLLLCIYNGYTSPSLFVKCITPLIALVIVLSATFYESLDLRNKELYQSCQRTATVIEFQLFGKQLDWTFLSTKGLFFDLNKSFKLSELLNIEAINADKFVPELELHNFTKKNYIQTATHSKLFDYFFFMIKLVGLIIFSILAFKIWYLNYQTIFNYYTHREWIGLLVTVLVPTIGLTIFNWKKLFRNR